MTSAAAPRPEWVEAGALALVEAWRAGSIDNDDLARAVIAAVEPLRALDPRDNCRAEGMALCGCCYVTREQDEVIRDLTSSWREAVRLTRAQIAAEIEELEVRSPWGPAGPDLVARNAAMRAARGES